MTLEARSVGKRYANSLLALSDVSFRLERGRTLGIVGESGSGKSTLARIAARLMAPDTGEVRYDGADLRRGVQIIFQEPSQSLDPRWTVAESVAEPLRLDGLCDRSAMRQKVLALLEAVELPPAIIERRPARLSGGECQRVAIARALARDPEFLICDEPVASLDPISRAQVLNALLRLQDRNKVGLLFISHDLKVVRHMADDVLVLEKGRVIETGPAASVFSRPTHPTTRLMVQSACKYELPGL